MSDLLQEFYVPMKKTCLLNKDQLDSIFLNLDELIHVNTYFLGKLRAAINIANHNNDEVSKEEPRQLLPHYIYP